MTSCNDDSLNGEKSVETGEICDKKEDSSDIKAKETTEVIDLTKDECVATSLYAQNQRYIDEIAEEVRRTQPLVSEKQDILQLSSLYDESSNPAFFSKALELSRKYSHIRFIRGDGNCFYRSVLTALLETCLSNANELTRMIALCQDWKQKLVALGSPEFIVDDYCDSMKIVLESMSSGTKTMDILMHDLNIDSIANYYVAFVRAICAGYIRLHPDEFAGFIDGGRTVDQYCSEEIEPFWKDCDHMCIVSVVKAIGVPIRIEYMDQNLAPSGAFHHDFLIDGQGVPKLYFLYRPGHYDVLYPRDKKTS